MKIYTIISAVFLLAGLSVAQVVLGPERQIAAGDKITMQEMDTTGVNEGLSGENQTWNFNGLAMQDALVMEYVDASSTPFHSDFPGATLAGVVSEGEIASYTYYSLGDNKLFSHGTSSGGFSNTFHNLQVIASYPFGYGSSFSDDFEGITDMGEGMISKKYGETLSLGDAYGTITLPDGSVHNALRVKSVQSSVDSLFMEEFFFGETVFNFTSYNWYINGLKFPVFSISYVYSEFLGNVFESKSVTYIPHTTTGVEDEKEIIISSFELEQNFPNPFNPSTKISFTLNEKSYISLKIYNVIGKEVAVLAEGEREAGVYSLDFNAADLSAGVYFYTLSSKNFKETKKMMLLK